MAKDEEVGKWDDSAAAVAGPQGSLDGHGRAKREAGRTQTGAAGLSFECRPGFYRYRDKGDHSRTNLSSPKQTVSRSEQGRGEKTRLCSPGPARVHCSELRACCSAKGNVWPSRVASLGL